MTRQIISTSNPDERTEVQMDFDTFFLPFDASLDLTGIINGNDPRTVYAVTDPAAPLSMVNVRHLKDYTQFRGQWETAPEDNPQAIPYEQGHIVAHTDSAANGNNVIYIRTGTALTTNPNPASDDGTHWTALGVQVRQGNLQTMPANTTNDTPGLVLDGTTLQFRGYTSGSGVNVDNASGEISIVNMSITDVHVFTTAQNRNNGIEAGNSTATSSLRWHVGDVAIVTTDTDQSTTGSGTEGQGTYIYTGTPQTNFATTDNDDWTELSLPTDIVRSVAGITGPTRANPTAAEIAAAIDEHIDLGDLGNVTISNPMDGQHLVYDDDAANGGTNAGWRNHRGEETALELQNLSNVNDTEPGSSDRSALFWNGTEWTPGTLSIRGYQYDSTASGINVRGLPAGSNTDSIPKVFTGTGSPSDTTTGVSGFSGEAVRHTGDFYVDTAADVLYFFDGTRWARSTPGSLDAIGDVNTGAVEHNILQRNGSNQWVPVTPATVLGRETANRLLDITYTGDLPATTTYSLITEEDLASTVRVQSQTTTSPVGHAFSGFGGNLDFSGVNIDDRVYFATTMGSSISPPGAGILGPFRVTGTSSNNRTLFIARTGDDFMSATQRATIIGTAHYVYLVGSERVPMNPGDLLTWNGSSWINTRVGDISLSDSPLSLLSDVNYDDDVESLLYSVTVRESDRQAANRVTFGPTRTQMVEGSSQTVATLFAGTGNANFQIRDFSIGDTVYLSENAPPITSLATEDDGPYTVVDLVNNNPVFIIGTQSDQVPLGIHNFVDGSRDYWAYIEIPALRGVVRPADVLVRSNDGEFWINETAAQMASNVNGGIRLQDLRDTTEIHDTRQEFMGTPTGVTINSATRTSPASITLNISDNITPNPATDDLLRFSNSGTIYQVVTYLPNFVVSRMDNQLISDEDLTAINNDDPTIETGVFGTVEVPLDQNEILAWDATTNTWRNRTLAEVSNVANTGIGLNDLNDTTVPTNTADIADNSVLHWDRTAGTWEPTTLGSAQVGNVNLEDLRDVNPGASEGQILVRREFDSNSENDRWVPGGLEVENLTDVNITGTSRDGTITRTATSSTVTVPTVDSRGQPNISFDTSDGNRHSLSAGDFIAFGSTDSSPVYTVVDLPVGSTVIVAARRDGENTANVANLAGATLYLVDIPMVNEPLDGEILTYRRTSTLGGGNWVNVQLTEQDRLEFTEDNNLATLTGYRSESGTLNVVRDATFIDNPNVPGDPANRNQLLQLTLSTFPTAPATGFTDRTIDWDVPYGRTLSQNNSFSLGVSIDNPRDFMSQFVNDVTALTINNGNSLTLTDFTATPSTTNIVGGTDWFERYVIASASNFIRDNATGANGSTTTITYTLRDNTGETYTAMQTITWRSPMFTAGFTTPTARPFWQNFTGIAFSADTANVATPANSDMTFTQSGSNQFTNFQTASANDLDYDRTLLFTDRVYKDNRQSSDLPSVTARVAVTRSADVANNPGTFTINASNNPILASIPAFTEPQLRFTTPLLSTPITAYNSADTDGAILTGTFTDAIETNVNGLDLQSGVTQTSFSSQSPFDNTLTAGTYWFGQQGSTAPTIMAFVGGQFQPITAGTRVAPVAFSVANLSGSGVPSSWTTVDYTFIGVNLPSSTRIQVT